MSQRLWLLLEWLDERPLSYYGVADTDSLMMNDDNLHTGKLVFVRNKYGNGARRGQILKVSDNKNYLKEFRMILEQQDQQVKNVVSLCTNTIKEVNNGHLANQASCNRPTKLNAGTSAVCIRSGVQEQFYDRRPSSSTPASDGHIAKKVKLNSEQPDAEISYPPSQIAAMDTASNRVYRQFISFITDGRVDDSLMCFVNDSCPTCPLRLVLLTILEQAFLQLGY